MYYDYRTSQFTWSRIRNNIKRQFFSLNIKKDISNKKRSYCWCMTIFHIEKIKLQTMELQVSSGNIFQFRNSKKTEKTQEISNSKKN